ncbi:MAG: RidA family protein [Candidatus Tyrphobacter sp.]
MPSTSVLSKDAPAPIGPYSQAIHTGDWLFCAGQGAMDPHSGDLVNESVTAETHQTLKNLGNVLREGGFDYADVVKTTVFLIDMNDFAEMNAVYATYFDATKPARSTVAVKALPRGLRVEIEAIAHKP